MMDGSSLQTLRPGSMRRGPVIAGAIVVAVAVLAAALVFARGGTTPASALADGEHFGFVSEVTSTSVVVDPAEFLTGDEAIEAAVGDGALAPGEELPNDFYVRDGAPGPTELPLADGFQASLLDNRTITHRSPLDATQLAALFAGDADASWVYDSLERLPMVVTVVDGEVVQAVQHYLP